jgi:hypothetical protein
MKSIVGIPSRVDAVDYEAYPALTKDLNQHNGAFGK